LVWRNKKFLKPQVLILSFSASAENIFEDPMPARWISQFMRPDLGEYHEEY
jgi:hypothetical protein